LFAGNPKENLLTVQKPDGEQVTYDPSRLRGISAYREIKRGFAVGDRLQFTAPNREIGVANRDLGTILGAVNFDSEGNIYSTTLGGGSSNDGVVFRLNADGYREQFVSLGGASGSAPMAGVLIDQASGDVYGTSSGGQGPSNGTVYRVAGGKQTLIWAFNGTSGNDGAKPEGALIATHGSLFGTTAEGGILNSSCGNNGCGTVFEISK
jgi:uncharacterized repeat protein (TIGR03803 family)